MKKIFLIFLFTVFGITYAQNIQFLGGVNSNNDFVNFATVEFYKTQECGSIYYVTDLKISKDGFSEAYTEISKYWNINKLGSLTVQYNVGINKYFQIKPVYLAGISKSFSYDKFNIQFDAMYHYQVECTSEEKTHGYQITTIFSQDFKKMQYSGYLDFWNSKYFTFEPQGWWKFSKRVWAGLEWRASNYDLYGDYENYFMFGFKYNLE